MISAVRRETYRRPIDLKVHPHMLRHACGYALADKGIDTRGRLC